MDQFLLFGDSITQFGYSQEQDFNFATALADAYIRRLDVINRGLSGYNTRQALHVLPQVIPSPRHANLRFMTIFLGANDARLPDTPGAPQQHVPLDEFADNLRAIATHDAVRAHRGLRLILITTPPVDERKLLDGGMARYPEQGRVVRRTAETTAKYAQAVRDVGQELGVPVLDLWKAMVERAGGELGERPIVGSEEAPYNAILDEMLIDGLHFSGKGYRLLFDELMGLIERTWPDQMPGKLPFVLLTWDDGYWEGKGLQNKQQM